MKTSESKGKGKLSTFEKRARSAINRRSGDGKKGSIRRSFRDQFVEKLSLKDNEEGYVLDTNFFISGFQSNTNSFLVLASFFPNIRWVVPTQVYNEMSWSLRNGIFAALTGVKIDHDRLKRYEDYARKKVGQLPQTPDMAVILLGRDTKLPIISSDLKLIQVARKLGLKATVNSAFLLELNQRLAEDDPKRETIERIYSRLLTGEIEHSVRRQDTYNPVARIQEIIASGLDSVRVANASQQEQTSVIDVDPDTLIEQELFAYDNEIRGDLDDIIGEFTSGNLVVLSQELEQTLHILLELMIELSLEMNNLQNIFYLKARVTCAHLLFILCNIYLARGQVRRAGNCMDRLMLLSLEIEDELDSMKFEYHLQRIRISLLQHNFKELSTYFGRGFLQQNTIDNKHKSILQAATLATSALHTREIVRTASLDNLSSISFLDYLGHLLAVNEQYEDAILVIIQNSYATVNTENFGVALPFFDVMYMLQLVLQDEEIYQEILELEKHMISINPHISEFNLTERITNIGHDKSSVLKPYESVGMRPKSKELHQDLKNWITIITTVEEKYKRKNNVKIYLGVEWNTGLFLALIFPDDILIDEVLFGTQIKINSGKGKVLKRPKDLASYSIDAVIEFPKQKSIQVLVKNFGNLQVTGALPEVDTYEV